MTVPLLCLAVMIVITIATKFPVGFAMAKSEGHYDNRHPRAQQAKLTGWGARALASHQNSFEALILFTPAVLISHLAMNGATRDHAAALAIGFIICRIFYPILYIANWHLLRSAVWSLGFFCSLGLAFLPLFEH